MKRTKHKSIVSVVATLAMLLSVFSGDGAFLPQVENPLVITASANDDNNSDAMDDEDDSRRVRFQDGSGNNLASGFFTAGFSVTLVHPDNWEIYYTVAHANGNTNGSLTTNSGHTFRHPVMRRHDGGVSPAEVRQDARGRWELTGSLDSRATRYGGPIQVPADAEAFTISTVARSPSGELSDVRTRSWVRQRGGSGNDPAFHGNMMIFSLYADANHIYDDSLGIFGAGEDRNEWVRAYSAISSRSEAQILADMDSHLTQGDYPPTLPANFTKRGRGAAERPVHVEMWDSQGTRHISQRAGMRIKGGWSRGTFVYEQKTFELYARSGYGDRGNFLFPLFDQQNNIIIGAAQGNLMHRYERFRLRNGGTDREQMYMRDELGADLARLSGFPAPQNHRPAVVFLNGAYYGLVWMKSPRTNDHWQRLYGGREGGFEMIGSNEMGRASCGRSHCGRAVPGQQKTEANRPIPALCGDTVSGNYIQCGRNDCDWYHSSFNNACQELGYCRGTWRTPEGRMAPVSSAGSGSWDEVVRLAGSLSSSDTSSQSTFEPWGSSPPRVSLTTPNGLENAANWARFQQIVDVDNLFHYYALQIWGGNVDWPSNNMEMWRYYPNEAELELIRQGRMHPHLDGKWRFVAQDLEYGMGLWQNGEPLPSATNEADDTIWALLQRRGAQTSSQLGGRSHFNATNSASFMMPALLGRPDASSAFQGRPEMRGKLANALNDIMQNSHNWSRSQRIHGQLEWFIRDEHRRMLGGPSSRSNAATLRISELPRNGMPSGQAPDFPSYGGEENSLYPGSANDGGRLHLVRFLENRQRNMEGFIRSTLAPSGTQARVSVTIAGTEGSHGGWATLNTLPLGVHINQVAPGTWNDSGHNDPRVGLTKEGNYYVGGGNWVPIVAYPWPGYIATVTGAERDPNSINPNAYRVTAGGSVTITFSIDPNANLQITAAQPRQGNWWEISNLSDRPLSTKGLYITDSNNDTKHRLPSVIIQPQQRLFVPAGSNDREAGLKGVQPDFGISFGERLRLFDATTGENVQLVEITYVEPQGSPIAPDHARGYTGRGDVMWRQPDGNWRIETMTDVTSWRGSRPDRQGAIRRDWIG
jgi:hypothetical protein